MTIPLTMLTLIDTATETVKQSLTTFVENGLECNTETIIATKQEPESSRSISDGTCRASVTQCRKWWRVSCGPMPN